MKTSILAEIKNIFRCNNCFCIIIFLNICIFVATLLVNLVCFIGEFPLSLIDISNYAGVSSNIDILLQRPWTIITYMFYHTSFVHIILNLLAFYGFGRLFLQFLSQRQLLGVYFLGGILGALFFILAYNLVPMFANSKNVAIAIGASGAIMAVMFATARIAPNHIVRLSFIGNIKMKYLALIVIGIDILCIPLGNAGGHIAHLGGAAFGYIFALCYKHNHDLTAFLAFIERPRKQHKISNYHTIDSDYNQRKATRDKNIDRILEKISESGYASLSDKEKEYLFKNSKN